MSDRPSTPHLDRVHVPADLRQFSDAELHKRRRRVARRDDFGRFRHRGAPRRGAWRGRVDRRAPRRLRGAARPDRLGRVAPDLSAQDPHGPARPDPDAADEGRPVGLHQAVGKPLRCVRGGAFLHLDLRGARLRDGPRDRPAGAGDRRLHRGDRRWRDERRTRLRGDEQRRPSGQAAYRHPQRQRDVDRAARGRHVGLSLAPLCGRALPGAQGGREGRREPPARTFSRRSQARARRAQAHAGGRHAVRGTGLRLCRARRRSRPRRAPAGAAHGEGAGRRAGAHPRGDEEGQGLRPGGACRGPRPRSGQVRRGDRGTGQGRPRTRRPTPRSSRRA
jgi:hypothetical protein